MTATPDHPVSSQYEFPLPPAKFTEEHFHRLLLHCSAIGASDMKVQTNNSIFAKVNGKVHRLNTRNLPPAEVEGILMTLYGTNGPARIKSGNAIDKAYELHPTRTERFRYRVNATGGPALGARGMEITIRMISIDPPTMDQVGLEQGIRDGAFPKDGIFIMAGATGSGKSTTLAAIIRHMLEEVDGNRFICTFEAPIEYVYDTVYKPSSTIFQSEIGEDGDLKSFADGIRSAMRRAPDVILNGEMRDVPTIESTLAAAQSGHAVYTTVHANSVVETFQRVVGFFPHEVRHSILNGLLASVRAICWQSLLRTPDGKRCALREFLIFTQDVREELLSIGADSMEKMLIRLKQLVAERGQSVEACALRLFEAGKINEHELKIARSFG